MDEHALETILSRMGCPTPFHQVRTMILGCVAATNMVPLSVLQQELWQGEDPVFDGMDQAQQYFAALMNLWNDLARCQSGESFRLTPAPPPTWEGVKRRIVIRNEEIEGFIRGLDLGGSDPHAAPPSVRRKLEFFALLSTLFDRYLELLEKEGPETPLENTLRVLDQADETLARDMASMTYEQARARARLLGAGPSPIGTPPAAAGRAPVRARRVGRNEPCPCGSGRKYKHCCGRG
ncbi:MAG: SEC-C domain-containing protein [Firmicutes bacterium]|nr:SEC-C domain-containing protein [Bacillota bacterium]